MRYSIYKDNKWVVVDEEEYNSYEGNKCKTDTTPFKMFKIEEESDFIKDAISMGLKRWDFYDEMVSFKPKDDFAERQIRITGLNPRGRIYKVIGRRAAGAEVKMPLDVLEQLGAI